MTNTALERYDDRELERLRIRAGIIAKMSGLKAQIAEHPDVAFAIALDLYQRGFEPTPGNVNMAYHWVNDRAEYSTQFYTALARLHGWTVRRVGQLTRDLARVRATKPGEEAVEVEWTLEDAIESHRLDAWVEDWRTAQSGKRYAATYVIRINGQPETWYGEVRGPLPEKLPQWVAVAVEDPGRVKTFEAWWRYRRDMMLKSAVKRAVKEAIPDILLGAAGDHELTVVAPAAPSRGSSPAGAAAGPEDDDEVVDGEIVDDDEPVPAHVHDNAPEARGYGAETQPPRYEPGDPGRPF